MFTNVAELTNHVKEMELLLRCLFFHIFATCREYFSKQAVCDVLIRTCVMMHMLSRGHPARSLLISNCDPQLKSCHFKQRAPP